MNSKAGVRPSWWWCSLGIAAIFAGFVLFCYALIHDLPAVTNSLTQIVVPAEKDLSLLPNRTYTIFLEQESVVDGQIYSTDNVSGLTCNVKSMASGDKVSLRHPSVNTSYALGGRAGKSVLEFNTTADGVYHIACDYGEGREGPQAVIAVGSGVTWRIFSLVGKALLSIVGGLFLGACIILTVLILRQRSKKEIARLNQPDGYPA